MTVIVPGERPGAIVPPWLFRLPWQEPTVNRPAVKAIVKVPVAAYVEKVYEEGDFSQLGIAT